MEFQQKFKKNKSTFDTYDDILSCMKHCKTVFQPLLSQQNIQCLNTCGYNRAFIRDCAINYMIENPRPRTQ